MTDSLNENDDIKKEKNSRKAIGTLFLAVFVDLLGFGIIIPLLPFWATDLNATPTIYGILVAIYSIMQFIFAPFWGRLSDHYGRRPIILIGLVGSFIGFSLLAVTAFFINTLIMLFLSRIISGIFTGATLPTSQAFISDTTSGKDRAKGFGILGAAFGLGFSLGPGIGGGLYFVGTLIQTNPYGLPAIFSAILALINILMGISFLPETYPPEKRQQVLLKRQKQLENATRSRFEILTVFSQNPTLLTIVILFAVVTLAFSSMETTLALFGGLRGFLDPTTAAGVFLVVGIVAIITQGGLIRPLSERFADSLLISSGIFLLAISFFALAHVFSLIEMMVWAIPLAFGSSIATPALGSLLSKTAPKERQGEILGINQGISSLMRIFGPLLGNSLLDISTFLPYQVGAAILFIAFLISLLLLKMTQKKTLMTSTCINCGFRLQEGAAFCQQCGLEF